jgi:cytoskeleton protein RodZ
MQTEAHLDQPAEGEAAADSASTMTAGSLLQQERQRLGLNEKEVADQLHITMHYVKALESNSFEKLPGAVFARGYLKSYAILLGVEVDEVLSRYDEFARQQKADMAEENRLIRERRKKDRNKPFVILSLIIFVSGFLGLWLANSYFSDDAVSNVPSTAESEAVIDNIRPALSQAIEPPTTTEPQLSLEVDAEEVSSAVSDTVMTEPYTAEVPVSPIQSAAAIDAAVTANTTGEASESADPATQTINPTVEDRTVALQAEQSVLNDSAATVDAPRVIAVESIGNDVLRISFSGESWVEVNDSESQQIYRDIREAGDVLEITGSAPFNILLGDAPFTTMSLNGDEIDLSADIRIDNSARLTVGL